MQRLVRRCKTRVQQAQLVPGGGACRCGSMQRPRWRRLLEPTRLHLDGSHEWRKRRSRAGAGVLVRPQSCDLCSRPVEVRYLIPKQRGRTVPKSACHDILPPLHLCRFGNCQAEVQARMLHGGWAVRPHTKCRCLLAHTLHRTTTPGPHVGGGGSELFK